MTYQSTFKTDGMSSEALAAWEEFERRTGGHTVNSAYRSPEHNAKVGGAKHSQHTHGNAFDIDVSNLSHEERNRLIREARASGFSGVGVYNNALHFDVGPQRHWGPDYSRGSTPEWALEALGAPVASVGAQPGHSPHNALTGGPAASPEAERLNKLAMLSMVAPKYEMGQPVQNFLVMR